MPSIDFCQSLTHPGGYQLLWDGERIGPCDLPLTTAAGLVLALQTALDPADCSADCEADCFTDAPCLWPGCRRTATNPDEPWCDRHDSNPWDSGKAAYDPIRSDLWWAIARWHRAQHQHRRALPIWHLPPHSERL